MLNRWIGILLFALMASANVGLFLHDVLPRLTAGVPPTPQVITLKPGEIRWVQTGIFDARGRSVGRSWTRVHRGPTVSTHELYTYLDRILLPGTTLPPIHVQMKLTYQKNQDVVDDLRMHLFGLPFVVQLEGGLVSSEFPIIWKFGQQQGQFILDAQATKALGDALRPFERLPDLEVGQSWRLELLNPLTGLIPGVRDAGIDLSGVLVRVTRREMIEWHDEKVETLRVEAPNTVGWVTPDGRVLRQEVDVPLLGKLVIIDEPFNETVYRRTEEYFRELIQIPEPASRPAEEGRPDNG